MKQKIPLPNRSLKWIFYFYLGILCIEGKSLKLSTLDFQCGLQQGKSLKRTLALSRYVIAYELDSESNFLTLMRNMN